MQAVILAAGNGTRMRPLTYDIPKPMLPLNGKPIIDYTLSFLPSCIDEVVIVINYLGEHIKKYLGNSYKGIPIRYVFQESLNGTGGALYSCKDILEDKFLVVMGDDLYYYKDLERIVKEDLAILVFEVNNSTSLGVLKIDEKGNLVEIVENLKVEGSALTSTNAFILSEKFFNYPLIPKVKGSSEFGLPQMLVNMAREHKVKIIQATRWYPIGKPEDLKEAEVVLKNFLR